MENLNGMSWGLEPLHKKQLEILLYVDAVCAELGLDYCLAFGTALGAVRHGGPIPWDDDADIHMTLPGLRQFMDWFEKEGDHERFYIEDHGVKSGVGMAVKIRMNGTTFIEPLKKDWDMHHGIYIDVFGLADAPKSRAGQIKVYMAEVFLAMKSLARRHYVRRKSWLPVLALMRLWPNSPLNRWAEHILRRNNRRGGSDTYFGNDIHPHQEAFFPKKSIFPAGRMDYMGRSLAVPADPEFYLRQLYKDYRKLPDLKTVRDEQHAAFWRVDEDFRNYVPNVSTFADEG